MIYDNNYNDNIILKREAFQNLLTNIKNYPIIDVDYVEEFETDNLHGNNVWKGFTHNTPCLKITYGNDSTTKGNSMFASVDQKKALFDYERALKQLQIEKNNKEYELKKLNIALQNNINFLSQEKEYLARILDKIETVTENKETFLQAGLSILLFPYASIKDRDYFNFGDIWSRDSNGGPLSTTEIDFTYVDLSLKYIENANEPNEKEVIVPLRYSEIHDYSRLLFFLSSLQNSTINVNGETQYYFTEDERQFYESFKNFIRGYNYLSLKDALKIEGNFTKEEIEQLQLGTINNHMLTQETLTIIRNKLHEIMNDEDWIWQDNTYPDFQNMITNYARNINNITTKIIGGYAQINLDENSYTPNTYYIKDNNNDYQPDPANTFQDNYIYYERIDGIININIRQIGEQIQELNADKDSGKYIPIQVTAETYLPNIYYINNNNNYEISSEPFDENQEYYKFDGSIQYYANQIALRQQDIENCQIEILNSSYGKDKTVYGYKYIKLGTNIKFDNNYNTYLGLNKTNSELNQHSGTFRLSINDDKFEVPIKGFDGNISDEDIYIQTQKQKDENLSELGAINFLGNIFGKGSLVTNSGHIYASQGSVIAGAYLALRSSVNRTDNVAGFRYNGDKHIIEAYDITGNAYKNGRYSTNIEDYILTYLPDSDTGQIYIPDSPENVFGRYEEVTLNNITYIPNTYYIEISPNNYRLDNSNQFNHYEEIQLNSSDYHPNTYYIKDNNGYYQLDQSNNFSSNKQYYQLKEITYYKFEKDYINYENRLTFNEAKINESDIINYGKEHSLHLTV